MFLDTSITAKDRRGQDEGDDMGLGRPCGERRERGHAGKTRRRGRTRRKGKNGNDSGRTLVDHLVVVERVRFESLQTESGEQAR